MAKKQRAGNSYKNQYSAYKTQNRLVRNRKKRLERLCKEQPNNEQLIKALQKVDQYTVRGGRSGGHVCKLRPLHAMPLNIPKPAKTVLEQFIELGLVKPRKPRVRKRKKTFTKSV